MTDLALGRTYTRNEIRELVGGGDLVSYLPQSSGRTVAGCFDPRINYRAPTEIDVGDGPTVLRTAQALASAGTPIPVFLKRQMNVWEYVGMFRPTGYSEAPADLAKPDRRADAVAVLYLEEIEKEDQLPTDLGVQLSASEGNAALIRHYRRERSRELVAAKKRSFRAIHGRLWCEVCSLEGRTDLGEAGEAFFEVHHLLPIESGIRRTQLDDLAVLCANCHRILHRIEPMPSLEEFRRLYSSA